jgi:hypothetical protein
MKRSLSTIGLVAAASACWAAETIDYEHILLKGDAAQVTIAVDGGAIADFHLGSDGLNPLSWKEEGEAEMTVELPLAGLAVKRSIALSKSNAVFTVREEVTNTNKLGRVYAMVQHPTIAPPFLDETTVIDANGRKGFMTYRPMPNPEDPPVTWPQALKDGEPVNVRFLTDDHDPNVVSYTLDEEYGWYVAYNAARELLLGYIWKSEDYPWLIDWRWAENGKPMARGLEFGTTALPWPFDVLVAKGEIFGTPLYEYLDAGQTAAKSYAAFLLEVPKDYRGVHDIDYADGRITIRERLVLYELAAKPDRDLVMDVGDLFQ